MLRAEAGALIDTVPDEGLRVLLRYRYLNGATWEHIAHRMGYSCKQAHRLHEKALSAIGEAGKDKSTDRGNVL